jgi:putative tryptophan/tyrosine transport system substrate-binding protein
MRRREFITFLGGAASAVAGPAVLRAQPAKSYRVGVLLVGNADRESVQTALREELRKTGLNEGRNLTLDIRSAEGKLDQLPRLAAELAASKVDLIYAIYTPCALAAQQATRDIPIVIVSGDPLGTGLVESVSRPGKNITGVSLVAAVLHGKCVEMFRDMIPRARRVGILAFEPDPFWKPILEQAAIAARTTGLEIAPVIKVRSNDEIDGAFATMKQEGADAVVVQATLPAKLTADLASKHRLPTATISRTFVEAGGIMAYGADSSAAFRHGAVFVGKILQGAKPAEMPVEQPIKFELVVNLKTAKAIGLTIPESFLVRADAIIE